MTTLQPAAAAPYPWPQQQTGQQLERTIYSAVRQGINHHVIPHANTMYKNYQTQLLQQNRMIQQELRTISLGQTEALDAMTKINSGIERFIKNRLEAKDEHKALREKDVYRTHQGFRVELEKLYAMLDGVEGVPEEKRSQCEMPRQPEHTVTSHKLRRSPRKTRVSKTADSGAGRRRSKRQHCKRQR